MATDVIKRIAASGGDYPDLNLFFAASPANLVTADQRWIAEIPIGELALAAAQVLPARTCDATRYFFIRPVSGEGIANHASKLANPLFYDSTKGAAISVSAASSISFDFSGAPYVRVEGVQLRSTNAAAYECVKFTTGSTVDGCIVDSAGRNAVLFSNPGCLARNSLMLTRATGYGGINFNATDGTITGCTVVALNGSTSGGGVSCAVQGLVAKDNAIFGYVAASVNFTTSSSNNMSDTAINAGTNNTTGLAKLSQFVSNSDFRPKAGGAIIGAGVTVSGRTTDILGQTVSGTPTIGAMEYSAASSAVSADLVIAYNVSAASGTSVSADLAIAYNVRSLVTADLTITYNIAADSASVTSEPAENNNGTAWTTETAHYSWFPGGRVGSLSGITPIEGSKPLVGGALTVTGLTPGTGLLWFVVRAAVAVDDATFAQHLTAA